MARIVKVVTQVDGTTDTTYNKVYVVTDELLKVSSKLPSGLGRMKETTVLSNIDLIDKSTEHKGSSPYAYTLYEIKRSGYGSVIYVLLDTPGFDTAVNIALKYMHSRAKHIPEDYVNLEEADKEGYITHVEELGKCFK